VLLGQQLLPPRQPLTSPRKQPHTFEKQQLVASNCFERRQGVALGAERVLRREEAQGRRRLVAARAASEADAGAVVAAAVVVSGPGLGRAGQGQLAAEPDDVACGQHGGQLEHCSVAAAAAAGLELR